MMDDTTAHVFSESAQLEIFGLTPPKAAMIAERLRSLGLFLEKDIFTIERLRQALIELKVKNGGKARA
jgi:hypothetical protein